MRSAILSIQYERAKMHFKAHALFSAMESCDAALELTETELKLNDCVVVSKIHSLKGLIHFSLNEIQSAHDAFEKARDEFKQILPWSKEHLTNHRYLQICNTVLSLKKQERMELVYDIPAFFGSRWQFRVDHDAIVIVDNMQLLCKFYQTQIRLNKDIHAAIDTNCINDIVKLVYQHIKMFDNKILEEILMAPRNVSSFETWAKNQFNYMHYFRVLLEEEQNYRNGHFIPKTLTLPSSQDVEYLRRQQQSIARLCYFCAFSLLKFAYHLLPFSNNMRGSDEYNCINELLTCANRNVKNIRYYVVLQRHSLSFAKTLEYFENDVERLLTYLQHEDIETLRSSIETLFVTHKMPLDLTVYLASLKYQPTVFSSSSSSSSSRSGELSEDRRNQVIRPT